MVFGIAAVFVAAGCVSVITPSTAPTSTPPLGVTTPAPQTATASATLSASTPVPSILVTPVPSAVEPSELPSEEPTEPSTNRPSVGPDQSAVASGSPPADGGDLLFEDDMGDETSGWDVGESGAVSVAYTGETLQLNVGAPGQAVWTNRNLPDEYAVVLSAGEFIPAGDDGVFGPLCRSDVGSLYGALVTTGGRLNFVAIENNVTRVLATHDELDLAIPVGSPTTLGVECAGTGTGAFRMVAVMPDGPLAVYQNVDDGPAAFHATSLYAEAQGDSFVLDVDRALAYGIEGSLEGMTSEGESLLTHVPGDLQSTCYEIPSTRTASAVLHCILQVEGTGAEVLSFQSFESSDDMNVAYQEVVDHFGVESTGTCESGPDETTWSVTGEVGGRVQCAPQQAGIRFDWTDDQLSILSTLIDFDGDYKNTYDLWLNAGPVENPI